MPHLAEGQQINQRRACVTSYPTRQQEGLLWVWADGSPNAEIEAAAGELRGMAPEIDELGNAAFAGPHKWYMRWVTMLVACLHWHEQADIPSQALVVCDQPSAHVASLV